MMLAFLTRLGRFAPQFMAVSVFVALLVPGLAHVAKPFLAPSVWALLFIAMVRLDWPGVILLVRQWRLLVAVLTWMLIANPLLIWSLLQLFDLPPGLAAALVLMAASAPLMSTPALSLMIGLDASLALVVMVAATFLAPVTVPVVALELTGLEIEIGSVGMMIRLLALVGSAFAAALLARHKLGNDRMQQHGQSLNGILVIVMAVFALAIMDGASVMLLADPGRVLKITLLSFVANAGLQAAGALVFWRLDPLQRYSIGFVCGMRNMGLILAVLPGDIDPDTVLYFAMGQFPIYILPALLKPFYGRLVGSQNRV